MTKLLTGIQIAEKNNSQIKKEVLKLSSTPKLVVISSGFDKASQLYIKNKEIAIKNSGILFQHFHFSKTTTNDLVSLIKKLNNDKEVTSILVQLPLSKNIDKTQVLEAISPLKDVDGFTSKNKGLLDTNVAKLIPCTALAIKNIIDFYKIDIKNKLTVIVGTSEVVGLPTAKLLINLGGTVILCNKNTKNLRSLTKLSDLLIVATGHRNLITKKDVKEKSIIINVGITRINNKIYGDVDFDDVFNKVSMITPTPGGIGPLTISNLLRNVLICYKLLGKK